MVSSRLLLWTIAASWIASHVSAKASFAQEPSDCSVVAGQPVTLMCVVANYSGIVQWTKDGLALGAEHHLPGWPRYSIVGSTQGGEHNLQVSRAELADDAVYECQATQAALRSRPAHLTVLIPPDEPTIENGPMVQLKAGTPYNLTCRAERAKPAAMITWYRDGTLQDGAHYSKMILDDGKRESATSKLLITPSDGDIGRTFSCRASNAAAPDGKQTSVRLNVQHPPTVRLSVHPQPVQEGETVKFTCSATANPDITGYRWAKGGALIEGATENTYETTVDHSYFTEPVSCEVHNAVGSTNVTTLVDVYFGPRIVTEPQPQTVDRGSDATFTCAWSGNPPLTLAWTRKGSNVVLSNSNMLLLKGVTQDDTGRYVCKAIVPRIGVGEKEVMLNVNGPPIISSDLLQHALRGEKGRVECFIGSTPPPDRIAWAWKENVLEVGTYERYTVETVSRVDGVLSTLTITNVMEGDFQTAYNCTAWNGFGSDTEIFTLREKEVLSQGIVIGAGVSAAVVLIIAAVAVIIFCCRQRRRICTACMMCVTAKKDIKICKHDPKVEIVHKDFDQIRKEMSEEDIKLPVMNGDQKFNYYPAYSDETDTKTEQTTEPSVSQDEADYKDLKDPTNGYYNVRAHEEQSTTRNAFSEFRPLARPLYEPRPPSRLSHASGYAHLGAYPARPYDYEQAGGFEPPQQPDGAVAASAAAGLGSGGVAARPPFGAHAQTGVYGGSVYAPASSSSSTAAAAAVGMAGPFGVGGSAGGVAGSGVGVYAYGRVPAFEGAGDTLDQASKHSLSSRFSYASQHSDFTARPLQQRMQTHV
ncbi:kin of IRRE-like protein 1 isoform X1 [Lampetra fluviatilis]